MPDERKDMSGETLSTIGRIKPRPIVAEMEESYLDYAMSVIIARALPDARDGLKPVHRRILYAMHELGLRSNTRFRKSALVVGDVLGKYHPHGDAPVYEALVRMAQDFAMRYPLIEGQGNFGSVDGDAAAAMRYTEVRMAKITDELLQDIEKETVSFQPNYDGSRKEPLVLPSKIPNLLLNGTVGIAVGMATNVPPHNLHELVDALLHLLEFPGATVEELVRFIKGPDFPTGGIVYDRSALKQAYLTGRGGVVVRGRCEIEEAKGGRYQIRITEIPYQVNKAALIEAMAELVQEKVLQGISDIRDESDREGIRIIVELKKDAYPQKILNQLYKRTDLQTSFGYNMIALADGLQPRLLNLQELLQIFIDHRRVVITKRVTFERDRAKERAHILEGLKKALDNINRVVETIKKSETKEVAKERLTKEFKLTEIQADAILEMKLRTLAGLERKKVEEELRDRLTFIAECEAILRDAKKVDAVLRKEFMDLKEAYGDERRTLIVATAVGEIGAKDTIPNVPMIVTLTRAGYVKRLSPQQFRAQNRGGVGVKGMETREDDEVLSLLHAMNHDALLFFTNTGRVFSLPVYELPQAGRVARGQAIVNLLQLQPEERITAMLRADLPAERYLFMVTEKGTVKRTSAEEFQNIRRSGLIAQKLPAGDALRWVVATKGSDEIVLLTRKGKAIRFPEEDVRSMGRAAAGVRGIRLAPEDHVVEAAVVREPARRTLLVVMQNGLGKMTPVEQYRFQGRGGSGVMAARLTAKTGDIVGGCVLEEGIDGDLICISKQGQTIRTKLSEIPSRSRATQGVIVMRLKARDSVASMNVVFEDKEGEAATARAVEEERIEGVEEMRENRAVKVRIRHPVVPPPAPSPPPSPPPPLPTVAAPGGKGVRARVGKARSQKSPRSQKSQRKQRKGQKMKKVLKVRKVKKVVKVKREKKGPRRKGRKLRRRR